MMKIVVLKLRKWLQWSMILIVLGSLPLIAAASKSKAKADVSFSSGTLLLPSGEAKSEMSEVLVGKLHFFESSSNRSELFYYALKTGKKRKIELPLALQTRSLLYLFPSKDHSKKIYVFSQLHKAGADFPRVDLYDLAQDKWTVVKEEIDCVNFSDLKVIDEKLQLKCGEDYLHPPKKPVLSISLPGATPSTLENKLYKLQFIESKKDIEVKILESGKSFTLRSRLK